MMVWFCDPMSRINLDGHDIYGKKYSYGTMGPTKITSLLYWHNRDILIEDYYTDKILERLFGKNIGPIKFKLSELHKLSDSTLRHIVDVIGISHMPTQELDADERQILFTKIRNTLDKS